MSSIRGAVVALACLAFLGGCVELPSRPDVEHASPTCRVFASTAQEARTVAAEIPALHERVLELLEGGRREPPEVWVVSDLNIPGKTASWSFGPLDGAPWILVRDDYLGETFLQHVLAHELVHYCLGDEWATLPQALEEGLCEVIAARVVGYDELIDLRWFGARRAQDLRVEVVAGEKTILGAVLEGRVPPLVEVFEEEPRSQSHDRAAYTVGYAVAERLWARGGLAAFRELVERAEAERLDTVPPNWILQASGLRDRKELAAYAGEQLNARQKLSQALELFRFPALIATALAQANAREARAALSQVLGSSVSLGGRALAQLDARLRERAQPLFLRLLLARSPVLGLKGLSVSIPLTESSSVQALLQDDASKRR